MERRKSVGEYPEVSIFPKRPKIPPEVKCRQKPPPGGFLTQFTFQSYREPLFFNFSFKTTWNPKIGRRISRWCIQVLSFPNTSQFHRKCCAGKNPRPEASQRSLHFSSIMNRYFFISLIRRHGTGQISRRISRISIFSQTPQNFTGSEVQAKTPARRLLNAIYVSVLSWTVIF